MEHQTDVEESPAKNDEIALYILETKNKNSVFNYVSYEPELQQILLFFENSLNEANDFLVRKKAKDRPEVEGRFSFADIQRDLQFKNSELKKHVTEKLDNLLYSYR